MIANMDIINTVNLFVSRFKGLIKNNKGKLKTPKRNTKMKIVLDKRCTVA
jgi:hypothetical protein